jgi:hypothetical protein
LILQTEQHIVLQDVVEVHVQFDNSTREEVAVSFEQQCAALTATPALSRGSVLPHCYVRTEQRPDGSGKRAVACSAFKLLVEDKAQLAKLLDPATGRLCVPGTDQQLAARFNDLPVRAFTIEGMRGADIRVVRASLERLGVYVLAAAWAKVGDQQCKDTLCLAAAVTGPASSSA